MKNTKKCFVDFSFYDRSGIESFLEKQAENGWMLDKAGILFWHFHRIRPGKIHFSVVYFAKASAFDPSPSEAQLVFQDFCEHTGWKLAAADAQLQIFYNEAADPPALETDPALETASIHAAAKKSFLPYHYFFALAGLFNLLLSFWRFRMDFIRFLSDNADILCGISWILVMVLSLTEIIAYYAWRKRAKAAAKLEESLPETKGHHGLRVLIVLLELAAACFLLISFCGNGPVQIVLSVCAAVAGICVIIILIYELMKKLHFRAGLNLCITLILTVLLSVGFSGFLFRALDQVHSLRLNKQAAETYEFRGHTLPVYHDSLPLTIEDLIDTDYEGYSYESSGGDQSVFLAYEDARQSPRFDALENPELKYSVVTVRAHFLYAWCKKVLLGRLADDYARPVPEDAGWEAHIETDPAPWKANEVYQLELGGEMQLHFLLCYDECIVSISFDTDWPLTDSQRNIIAEKLGKRP